MRTRSHPRAAAIAVTALLAGVAACLADARAGSFGSQHCADSLRVRFEPPEPPEGTLIRVFVSGFGPGTHLQGTLHGERLHFIPAKGDPAAAVSLAGLPLDDARTLPLLLVCTVGESQDTLNASLTLAVASYPVEKLRVSPQFATKPDSALQERIRRESARAIAVARGSHDTPRLWEEPFLLPRTSRVTSGFGRAREFNGTLQSRHLGTDFAGASGDSVRATNRGVVRIVDAFFYGGNVVYLDHGDGLSTAYLHLSAHQVAEGDTVERGQLIGRVGATGRVTGPHLHFIVRYGALSIDPASLFLIAGDSAARAAAW